VVDEVVPMGKTIRNAGSVSADERLFCGYDPERRIDPLMQTGGGGERDICYLGGGGRK